MAKRANEMTAYQVRRIRKVGMTAVGGVAGLYLDYRGPKSKSWLLRADLNGKRPELGLGSFPEISLEKAREKAVEAKALMSKGIDPREEEKKAKAKREAEALARLTFKEAADKCWKAKSKGFKSAKHTEQWMTTLEQYAFPVLGHLYPEDIQTAHVVKVLEPIWETKTDSASKLRGRIETVISYAFALRQLKNVQNPARWKDNLDRLFASARKLIRKKETHHPAVPWQRMPAFWAALRTRGWRITKDAPYGSLGPRMLELAILTTSRDHEVRGAKWDEFDLENKTWTVPAGRMKGDLKHEVPLCDAAVDLLKSLPRMDGCEYVFPGARRRDGAYGMLSGATMGKVIDDMHEADIRAGGIGFLDPEVNRIATPHGTARSSFKDWSGNCTGYADPVSELCLAHVNTDATRAAYARDQLMGPRRLMLEEYSLYLRRPSSSGKVVPIGSQRQQAGEAQAA